MSPDHLPVSLDVFAIWRGMQDWIVETVPDGASTNILLSSTGALKAVLILGSASPATHKN